MAQSIEVNVPDIGDFQDVTIIEVLVAPGDSVQKEDSLVTLESDKASMEIPSPHSGTIQSVSMAVGDKVSEGSSIVTVMVEASEGESTPPTTTETTEETPPETSADEEADLHTDLVVLGGGPGGYTAAFRAADLGKRVILIERYDQLGGVCLNVGCIPSKALLHMAQIVTEAREFAEHGVEFGTPKFDIDKLREWKESVIGRLTGGLAGLAKQRGVEVVNGYGRFVSSNRIEVEQAQGSVRVGFQHAIIAAGSQAMQLPGLPDDPRIIDSTGALALTDIPKSLLVVGGGIIGLEMATVYAALGSRVTVVELTEQLMPGCDADLAKPLQRRIKKHYEAVYLATRVAGIEAQKSGLKVSFEGAKAPQSARFDKVLLAVGRRPNGLFIGAEHAGVNVDEKDFIAVDEQQRTNVPHIFAIGDIAGEPMLAHKATHEGKVAAEVAAGEKSAFSALTIPSGAYTDPEVAWMGLTEADAKEQGVAYEKSTFPWAASGRSLALGRSEGMTKLLFDPETGRLLGAGIVGPGAGELIAETVLALEMGADAEDIGLTVHPHPTLSETICFAAEMFSGTITDLLPPKKK